MLSVRLSVCLSVPCLHLEGKRKGLWIPNLVGRVPGTPAPHGPISRSGGQRSRSRRLIALLAKNPYNFTACCPINLIFGSWRKDPLQWVTSLPWQRPFRPSVRLFVRRVPPPRAKTKWPRKTELGRKGPWDMSTPWTNFKVKGSKVKVMAANCAVCKKFSTSRFTLHRKISNKASNVTLLRLSIAFAWLLTKLDLGFVPSTAGTNRPRKSQNSTHVLNCEDDPIAGGFSMAAPPCFMIFALTE